jgi:hypothetical protein
MSDVETLFVSWLVGLALSCWLFFEATRSARVGQLLVPRRVVARSISSKHGVLSDARSP